MAAILLRRMNRELRKMRYRAAGSASLVLLSVAFYIGIGAMVPSAGDALEDKVDELRLADYLVHVEAGDESGTASLAALPGVREVEARLQIAARVFPGTGGTGRNVSAVLIGLDPAGRPSMNIPELRTGRYFDGNSSALLERSFAERNDLGAGDRMTVLAPSGPKEVAIAATVLSPEYMLLPLNPQSLLPFPGNLAVLYVPEDWLRSSFGLPGNFSNEFLFMLEGDAAAARKAVDERLAGDVVLYTLPKEEVYGYALIKEDLRQGESWAGIIAFVILLIAFFITYTSFTRLVQEQRREIGVLRALGYSRGAVLGSYLYLSLLIGLAGSGAGLLVGIPLAGIFSQFYVELMIGASLGAYVFPPAVIAAGALFGPLTAGLACGAAAFGTVRMEPQEAIRGTPPAFLGRRARRAGGSRARPASGSYMNRYALNNLRRNPGRTSVTVLAVTASIVLGGMVLLMYPAFINSMDEGLRETERWDLLVEFSMPLNSSEAARLVPVGTTASESVLRVEGRWSHDGREGATLLAGLERSGGLHVPRVSDGREPLSPGEVLVSKELAKDSGLSPGDTVALRSAAGAGNFTVSGTTDDYLGGFVLDIGALWNLSGAELCSGMYLKVPEGLRDGARAGLLGSPGVSEVYTSGTAFSGWMEFMETYISLIYVFSLVGVAMAAVTISNVVFISVLERYPEYGQLRAIGYSRREVSGSIVKEILLLTAVASVLGAPVTYGVLWGLEADFRAFFPTYRTIIHPADWAGYLFVVVLTFLFALVAMAPSLRSLGRMDIVKTVAGERFG